jgi:hypothetical protein
MLHGCSVLRIETLQGCDANKILRERKERSTRPFSLWGNEDSHHWLIRLNPTLRPLYGPSMYTLIDWAQRLQLRGKDLARWLQLYLSTHAAPFPVKVATLRDLSGSRTTALWKFHQRLRHALADLQDSDVLSAWEIDDADLVRVARGEAVTSSQRRHLDRQARRR